MAIFKRTIMKKLVRLYTEDPRVYELYPKPDYDQGVCFKKLAAERHFSFSSVYKSCGESAFLWAWLNFKATCSFCERQDFFRRTGEGEKARSIFEEIGRTPERLEKALNAINHLAQRRDLPTIAAFEKVIEQVNSGFLQYVDLEKLVQENSFSFLSPHQRQRYALEPLNTMSTGIEGYEENWHREHIPRPNGHKAIFDVYLDIPVAIGLFYDALPQALAGFLATDPETLLIYQFQGVRPEIVDKHNCSIGYGSSWGLEPLDWKKLLVECAASLAQSVGFRRLAIRSGHHNGWTKKVNPDGTPKFPLQRALAIYDGTAERLGFTQGEDKNWYRPI